MPTDEFNAKTGSPGLLTNLPPRGRRTAARTRNRKRLRSVSSPMQTTARPKNVRAGKKLVGREGWLKVGREALIREGIGGVEIKKLARTLKVTRGGFYWFFPSRKRLLDELLKDWEKTNSAAFEAVLRDVGRNGTAEFMAIADVWLKEKNYSPAWDASVRDWARTSTKVADTVRRVDDQRIAILKQVFLDMNYSDTEAFVRARIAYFHQVGYYTLGVKEPNEQRLRLLPHYVRILTGKS
jgi:AcrR family transcriptional regulator